MAAGSGRGDDFDAKLAALFDFVPADGGPEPDFDDEDDLDEEWDDDGETDDNDFGETDVEVGDPEYEVVAHTDADEPTDDPDDAGPAGPPLVAPRVPPGRPGTVAARIPPVVPATAAQAPAAERDDDHEGERLQKVLSRAGVGSRRTCELLIEAGRVRVNDVVAQLGRRCDPETDLITVDGAPIPTRAGLVHYVLNKPSGVVTTADDEHGRMTVLDLVPDEPRVFPVGRLDLDTEGLLLITNDGELAYRLTHPSFGVEKEYLAKVRGTPSESALRRLRDGVELDDGMTAPAKVALAGPDLVRVTIHEGRNRQVRRMLDAVGHPVLRLVRTRIGPLADRQLPPGRWRHLSADELQALGRAVRTTRTMRRAATFGAPRDDADGRPPGAAHDD